MTQTRTPEEYRGLLLDLDDLLDALNVPAGVRVRIVGACRRWPLILGMRVEEHHE